MKTFRSHVRLGSISLPTGFASSSDPSKLSLSWGGLLMMVAAGFAPQAMALIAKLGVIVTQEQAIGIELLVFVTLYGMLRKLFLKFAKVELPEISTPDTTQPQP